VPIYGVEVRTSVFFRSSRWWLGAGRKDVFGRAATPRLTGRFALYAAIALLVATASMFVFLRDEAVHRAEQTARFHTKFIADSILRDHLRPRDLAFR
jgi:hypothetical protein